MDRDQSKISVRLIERLLRNGTGPGGNLTPADLSRLLSIRRAESRAENPQYSQAFQHKIFGSSKYVVQSSVACSQHAHSSNSASTLLTIFGGRVADIRTFLLEERIPDGWQPRILSRMGLTMLAFNKVVGKVELGINESGAAKALKAKTT